LPGVRVANDNNIFSAKFDTAEEAAETKVKIINSLRTWEQFLHEDLEEEENVYVFEI
jgi:hypothetical protein